MAADPPLEKAAQPARKSSPKLALALLLTGPLLVNGISLMLAVIVFLKAAETCLPRELLWLGFSYYLAYALCSYCASRAVPPRLAPLTMRLSLCALGVLSFFLSRADGFASYLVFSALNGGIIGFYFAPFQIAMGGIKPCRTVAWTIAFYNVSWGIGAAFGPFVSGWLRQMGSPNLAGVAGGGSGWSREAVVGTIVCIGVAVHLLLDRPVLRDARAAMAQREQRPVAARTGAPATPAVAAVTAAAAVVGAVGPAGATVNLPTPALADAEAPFESTPQLRRIGFAGAAVITILRTGLLTTLWPALSEQEHLTASQQGLGLLLLGLPIPLLAPLWAKLHRRFDRPWLSLVLLVTGAIGVAALPFASWPGQLAGLTAVGTAISGLIYLAIFYANADPRWPSNSVGVTEFFIGGGGLIGPILLGWLAGADARAALPYVAGGVLALVAAVGVGVAWRRRDVSTIRSAGVD